MFPDAFYNHLSLVVNADKESNLYVGNTLSLGGFNPNTNCTNNFNNVQCIRTPSKSSDSKQGYWSSPAYWKYTQDGVNYNYMLYYAPTTEDNTAAPKALNGYQLLTSGSSGPIPPNPPTLSTTTRFCPKSPTPSGSSNGTARWEGVSCGHRTPKCRPE